MKLDEILDLRPEIVEGIVDAAPELAAGQLPEEVLDRVHPGAESRREVEGPSAMGLTHKFSQITPYELRHVLR